MLKKIAVVGLGQIGGSLVLGLRKRRVPCHLTGIDISRKRIRLLKDQLDAASTKWESIQNADLIFVCLHFQETMNYLRQAPRNVLIVDVCSSKAKILEDANQRKLRLVGGHPLTGNEREEEKGWDPDLFSDRPFFFCPSKGSSASDLKKVRKFIKKLGAYPVELDPVIHDQYVAMTSHFPAFLSQLFEQLSSGAPPLFQGPGYRSMTRLARTPPKLLETFLASNKENIMKSAAEMRWLLERWIQAHK